MNSGRHQDKEANGLDVYRVSVDRVVIQIRRELIFRILGVSLDSGQQSNERITLRGRKNIAELIGIEENDGKQSVAMLY